MNRSSVQDKLNQFYADPLVEQTKAAITLKIKEWLAGETVETQNAIINDLESYIGFRELEG